eukprot:symbB.v1.2.021954.t1/scaffold1926.1/size95923/10
MWPSHGGHHFGSQWEHGAVQFSQESAGPTQNNDGFWDRERFDIMQHQGGVYGAYGGMTPQPQWNGQPDSWMMSPPAHPNQSFSSTGLAGSNSTDSWSPSMVSNMMLNVPQQFDFFDQLEEEKRYSGTVKCFYGEKHTGHGFIACPEMYNRTGQDVYLHARQAHRCEVGDEVSFTVVFNSRKEPQARSVVKKKEEGKFLSKKREEAEKQATALRQKRTRIVEPPNQAGNVMTEEQALKFQKSLKGR